PAGGAAVGRPYRRRLPGRDRLRRRAPGRGVRPAGGRRPRSRPDPGAARARGGGARVSPESRDDDASPGAQLLADVVVVGGGPRAISLLERLTARLARKRADVAAAPDVLRVVLIDAVEVGAGATWRTDQTAEFLNNTYAAHTTIYPDASTPLTGPLTPGPDLMDWARAIAPREHAGAHRPTRPVGSTTAGSPMSGVVEDARPVASARPGWAVAEAATLEPWSFPTRRLQGVYYREQL